MKCDQARNMLLERLDGDTTFQPTPDLDLHIRECPACQAWYRQQELAAAALEKLEPYQVPEDFTARVLARLTEREPDPRREWTVRLSRVPTAVRQAYRDLKAGLSSPVGRRRLTPALITFAATLVVAIGLFAVWQGTEVPVTPGAATGSQAGLILAGGIVLVVLVVLGALFLRRK